jgi:cell division protein ZapA (FtsZ GTPase activity inhibitor)
MNNNISEDQIKKELKNMDQRLYELEEKMTSIDTKLSQVVDAILGNPLTKSGGFIKDIEIMKEKIQELENKVESQEEFKKKITWTFAIVVTVALILEYFVNIYSSIT